uniref:Transmembrane protein n=1 Tax=Chromera velia CCMP2878 TaxID=1169474 RepID=A0A0G4FHN1_9ALVE|eukprot:Cvel_17011.t1-p1 / transcript=Cvel_17011.t1 / gene=Cvel_17011 / organism=Chromera_velia_CCMP2878 / gene_product=hypothetical protein / transcript_product=hypothetical protein / location=Cvel_scaffold1337:11570-16137(+) / protein_length=488 / sequence_SO=supercontig / SO=protein_coding / is_pseudo=false
MQSTSAQGAASKDEDLASVTEESPLKKIAAGEHPRQPGGGGTDTNAAAEGDSQERPKQQGAASSSAPGGVRVALLVFLAVIFFTFIVVVFGSVKRPAAAPDVDINPARTSEAPVTTGQQNSGGTAETSSQFLSSSSDGNSGQPVSSDVPSDQGSPSAITALSTPALSECPPCPAASSAVSPAVEPSLPSTVCPNSTGLSSPSSVPQTGTGAFLSGQEAGRLLYLSDGLHHPLTAPRLFDPSLLSPLTQEFQEFIYRHQHPQDCSKAQFLISNQPSPGMGSELHQLGAALGNSLRTGKIFVFSSEAEQPEPSKSDAQAVVRPPQKREAVDDGGRDEVSQYWYRGQSVAYIMRLNSKAREKIRELRMGEETHLQKLIPYRGAIPTIEAMERGDAVLEKAPPSAYFPLPRGTVGAHIRRGDKRREMTLPPVKSFASLAEKIYKRQVPFARRTFFMSYDDGAAMGDILAEKKSAACLGSVCILGSDLTSAVL